MGLNRFSGKGCLRGLKVPKNNCKKKAHLNLTKFAKYINFVIDFDCTKKKIVIGVRTTTKFKAPHKKIIYFLEDLLMCFSQMIIFSIKN